eukprot:6479668-Amphidinium_carterae.2
MHNAVEWHKIELGMPESECQNGRSRTCVRPEDLQTSRWAYQHCEPCTPSARGQKPCCVTT